MLLRWSRSRPQNSNADVGSLPTPELGAYSISVAQPRHRISVQNQHRFWNPDKKAFVSIAGWQSNLTLEGWGPHWSPWPRRSQVARMVVAGLRDFRRPGSAHALLDCARRLRRSYELTSCGPLPCVVASIEAGFPASVLMDRLIARRSQSSAMLVTAAWPFMTPLMHSWFIHLDGHVEHKRKIELWK